MGDPSGIGPEVALKTAARMVEQTGVLPVLVGSRSVLERDIERFALPVELSIEGDSDRPNTIHLIESVHGDAREFPYGEPSAKSGRAAYDSIVKAVELTKVGSLDCIVTGPISKYAFNQAGLRFPGHTELLAQMTGAHRHAMMLAADKLRVTLVTTHIAIKDVAQSIASSEVVDKIELSEVFLTRYLDIKSPFLGVCALNPHAGEGGTFGTEERELEDAVRRANAEGIKVEGPLPADSMFAHRDRYDCIIANYHDQGLIPIKMLSFGKSVNVTLGLPIIRTSPDHGTAFDIAGKGEADPSSMIAAAQLAHRMALTGRISWQLTA